jgi:phosphate starvation-inducible PhoH-like protein
MATKKQKEMDYIPLREPLRALTETQAHYLLSIDDNIVTFGIGPSGTGKTAVATMRAADEFAAKRIEKIIITRPIVEVGNTLGFLPGTVEMKQAPYLAPVINELEARLGKGPLDYALKAKQIEATPIELMRGCNWHNCWVIIDEAQNTTVGQMKMLLTRVGRNCRVIINGDVNQIDIRVESGLVDALERLPGVCGVGVVEFTWEDVVRSRFVKDVLRAYET